MHGSLICRSIAQVRTGVVSTQHAAVQEGSRMQEERGAGSMSLRVKLPVFNCVIW